MWFCFSDVVQKRRLMVIGNRRQAYSPSSFSSSSPFISRSFFFLALCLNLFITRPYTPAHSLPPVACSEQLAWTYIYGFRDSMFQLNLIL